MPEAGSGGGGGVRPPFLQSLVFFCNHFEELQTALFEYFYEKVPRHFWKIAIVMRVLPSRDSEIRRTMVRIVKTVILKRPVKELFEVENTYYDTNETDKAREQKFRL